MAITLSEFAGVRFVLALMPTLLLAAAVGIYTGIALWGEEFIRQSTKVQRSRNDSL